MMKGLSSILLLSTLVFLSVNSVVSAQETCRDTEDGTCASSSAATSNLYQDAADMLDVAMHTYSYSCLRKLAIAFKDDLKNTESILNVNMEAIDAADFVSFARDNKKVLQEWLGLKDKTVKKDGKTVKISMESEGSFNKLWDMDVTKLEKGKVTVAIDTDNEENELVYGIVVDHVHKRAIVTFRGSETGEDWRSNAGINFKQVPNPHFVGGKEQPKKIKLHTGFHDYLLGKPWFSDSGIKYDIIKGGLAKVMKANPGYELFVTGHSLGGALSTIFTFYISSVMEDLGFSKPATLISFAAPLVGDKQWQTAFQQLEKDLTVRHLRVSVLEDVVPTAPISSPSPFDFFSPKYKHTGINLKLFDNSTCVLKHSFGMSTGPTEDTKTIDDWEFVALEFHTLVKYDARLDAVQAKLRGMQLVDLYKDREVLGNFATFE